MFLCTEDDVNDGLNNSKLEDLADPIATISSVEIFHQLCHSFVESNPKVRQVDELKFFQLKNDNQHRH